MTDASDLRRLGPYLVERELPACRLARRWLAVHERAQTTHTLYQFTRLKDKADQHRFLSVFERVSRATNPHVLAIEHVSLGRNAVGWVVTPYTGNQDGLVTLDTLVAQKGGTMSVPEATRAVRHLLEALVAGSEAGLSHGPIRMDEVLVDRHGSLVVEMLGVARLLTGSSTADAELLRDEAASAAEMAYTLLTGLPAEEPRIEIARLVRRLDKSWCAWIESALDLAGGGFASPAAALAALPGVSAIAPTPVPLTVRRVLTRLAVTAGLRRP